MNSIREALGMPRCTDAEYQRKQNELRKALIRNWKSAQGEDTFRVASSQHTPTKTCTPPSKTDII